MKGSFDYIVVGGGSAGCVLAARLSEDPDCEVLLIEGGGDDSHPDVRDPRRWTSLFYGSMDWGWKSAPMRSCHQRIDHVPRGRMLGGCHSHNASAWVRGHRSDFDRWALEGCAGWSWNDVLPIFRRIEDWQGPHSELRGKGGPMYVALPDSPSPLAAAFIEAAREVGLPVMDDINIPEPIGAGYFNFTIRNGQRFSVVDAYLRPAMRRANLTICMNSEADRLLFQGTRCTGVRWRMNGQTHSAAARREVVVSAGAIGSPRLLLLSGIGPADELRALGISVAVDLPGVGRNLQDHALLAGLVYECRGELPPIRNNGAESTLWWKSDARLLAPDLQPVFLEFPLASPELATRLPHERCYTISPSIVRPASRGSVTLAAADSTVAPNIDVNFLAQEADVTAMLASLALCREIGAARAFGEFRAKEVMPGAGSRDEHTEFIRNAVSTYFHPTSTCRMGLGPDCVVNPSLKVYGIDCLRVADASIMPFVTSGNTNAPTVMIGEKAADLIRQG